MLIIFITINLSFFPGLCLVVIKAGYSAVYIINSAFGSAFSSWVLSQGILQYITIHLYKLQLVSLINLCYMHYRTASDQGTYGLYEVIKGQTSLYQGREQGWWYFQASSQMIMPSLLLWCLSKRIAILVAKVTLGVHLSLHCIHIALDLGKRAFHSNCGFSSNITQYATV